MVMALLQKSSRYGRNLIKMACFLPISYAQCTNLLILEGQKHVFSPLLLYPFFYDFLTEVILFGQ
jgi:hypothetical protein